MGRNVLLSVCALLFLAVGSAVAQTRIISGTVSDAGSEQPIEGALVSVVGTDISTTTRDDGTFSIGTEEGSVRLLVRMIGYRRSEIVVPAQQREVDVFLEQDILRLEEVVVTGYATGVERRNLAQAVSTINEEEIAMAPAQSVESAFYARVAGADVQSNSGAPGGGMQIRLRGVSSILGASTPLYVVDGVIVNDGSVGSMLGTGSRFFTNANTGAEENSPNRIADLNPHDIESIEVLKGASAAAIYGSKANNGVILITTKRGRVGRPQFDITQGFGMSAMSNKLGLRRFETLEDAVAAFGPCAVPADAGRDPNASCVSDDGWEGVDDYYDHEEELAGNRPLSYETSLSVNGGTEDTRYFVSGLVKHDGGIITNTGYDKQSIKVNIDQNVGSGVQFQLSTNAVHTYASRGLTNNDNRSVSYWMAFPQIPTFIDIQQREDGTWPVSPANSNPLQTAALVKTDEDVYRFIGSGNLTWDVLSTARHDLRLSAVGGTDYFSQKNFTFAPPEAQFEPIDGKPGSSIEGTASNLNYNISLNAVHTYTPSGQLSATTSIGYQYEARDIDQILSVAEDLVGGLANIEAGTVTSLRQERQRTEEIGLFAQEEVLISERLMLTAGVRADRTSNNSDPDKIYLYPKGAASYRIPVGSGLLNELKLRAAYGESGNQPQYGTKFSPMNPSNIAGLQALRLGTTAADPDIRPERQKEIEGGLDLTLLDNRASLQATVYQKRITDLMVRQNLAPSTGFDQLNFNGGVMRTRGFEAAFMISPSTTRDFSWVSRTTFSMDRSVITDLPVEPFRPGGFGGLGGFYIREGDSPTRFIGNDTALVDNDPRCYAPYTDVPTPDCEQGDRIRNLDLGESRPDFTMGFSNDFTYKSISLSMMWHWQQGGQVANLTKWLYDLSRTSVDYADPCPESWNCGPDETLGEKRLELYPSRVTSIMLEDATFLKLRELRLTYNVPTTVVESIWSGARHVRFTLSGRDLLRFTGYTGMDPEVSNWGTASIARQQDVAPYPPSRSFWVSVNVGF